MEWGVIITGLILRFLHWLLTPVFWITSCSKRQKIPPITDKLLLESATSLARKIRDGEVSSEHVLTTFINRVKLVNPYLNAVVEERFEDALQDAREVDRRLTELRRLGLMDSVKKQQPFFGVPFTVKESCSLAGMSNAVGCIELSGRRAITDGDVVTSMKKAGGIPLLVSNTPELCLGWETCNLLTGVTNNPYRLNRTAGGSSGGEAALVASGASVLSVSSDIAGSIRIPAAFNGLFGHKPTPGMVSIQGHIPHLNDVQFPRFLSLGPLVRHAEDLYPALTVMADHNAHLMKLNEPVDVSRLRVFYMTESSDSAAFIKVDKCIKDKIKNAVEYLQNTCGATICEEKFKDFEDSVDMSISVFFSMRDIPNMLQDLQNPKREKNLIIEFLKFLVGFSARSLQGLTFAFISKTKLFIPESRHEFYREKAEKLRRDMTATLGTDGVFLYPVFVGPAHKHGQVFVKASGVAYSMLFNILGMPVTAVPMGLHEGMPLSIQVIAAPNQDRLCLAVAKELEKGFGGWQPPA